MRTLAVIPARLGSTRLPRKPLQLLGGEPLIARVWERAASAPGIDACVVATDSPEVAAVRQIRDAVVMTSARHQSGTERVAEVVQRPEYTAFDIIVNVQGDEPFVSHQAIDGALGLVTSGDFAVATVGATADPSVLNDPNVVKVVIGEHGRALYFSRAAIPYLRDRADAALRDAHVLQHAGVYVYARSALQRWIELAPHPLEQIEKLEQLRPLARGMTIGVAVVDGPIAPGIDTADDLAWANERWTAMAGAP